jgi:hypothetical protein
VTTVALALPLLAIVPLLGPSEPYRFGSVAEALPPDSVAGIVEATRSVGGPPWALLGWDSQVLPRVLYVDAFLPPTISAAKLRRGAFVRLLCKPIGDRPACGTWERESELGAYVQVADGPTDFGPIATVRGESERPIRVIGDFTDDELRSLVAYVRSRPTQPVRPGWVGASLSDFEPIRDILLREDGSVDVVCGLAFGQTARVSRPNGTWQLSGVGGWVR